MNRSAFLFILFLLPITASANFCDRFSCPNGYTEATICFVDPDANENAARRAAKHTTCGFSVDQYVISNTQDFGKAFVDIAKSCRKIKTLRFMGHGLSLIHI